MKTCPSCNAELPSDVHKCPSCGEWVGDFDAMLFQPVAGSAGISDKPKSAIICPACGERALPRQTRCLKCNSRLQSLANAWEDGSASEPIPLKAEDGAAPSTICPSCGAPIAAASVICIDCGFDKRKGRRLEMKHREDRPQEEEAEPRLQRRRGRTSERPRVASTVAIGLGVGLLLASLYIIPVWIQGPLFELGNGRKAPWLDLVSWPFVAVSALILLFGVIIRSR
jgi:ribosomal protein L32